MMWYLADNSLNDYLKSQVTLQGQYYSGQATQIDQATFSSNTGLATFQQLSLNNLEGLTSPQALIADNIQVQLAQSSPAQAKNTITIESVSINHAQVWIEDKGDSSKSNISQLAHAMTIKLAQDFPKQYPSVSAQIFAEQHPELNVAIAKKTKTMPTDFVETAAALEAREAKKKAPKRGKEQTKLSINNFTINKLVINHINNNTNSASQQIFTNITINGLYNHQALVSNQLGGEMMMQLLKQALELHKQAETRE